MVAWGPKYQAPNIEFVEGGIVVPLTRMDLATDKARGRFNAGVLYSDMSICRNGVQIKQSYDNEPDCNIEKNEIAELKGRYIFAGMCQNEHFGHFISESLSRLWAARALAGNFKGIVFYPRFNEMKIHNFATSILTSLLPETELIFLRRPTQVEWLAVPSQLAHCDNGYIYGHRLVKDMFEKYRKINKFAPKRVYVSRAALSKRLGSIACEHYIEENLRRQGYYILYPEQATFEEQLEIYHSADKLIFSDGSALHAYPFATRRDQEVFVVWRRRPTWSFEWQIKTFGGPKLIGRPSVTKHYVPLADGDNRVRALAVIDFADLKSQLADAHFIADLAWDQPTASDLETAMEGLGDARMRPFD